MQTFVLCSGCLGAKENLVTSQKMDLEELLEAGPDAVLGAEKAGVIRYVNHYTKRLFGYRRDELVRAPLELQVPESARLVHLSHRESFVADPRTRPMGAQSMLSGRGPMAPSSLRTSPCRPWAPRTACW